MGDSYCLCDVLSQPMLERKYSDIDFSNVLDNGYLEEILRFRNMLDSNIDQDNLVNFYNNINSLNVIINKRFNGFENCYDPIGNNIYLDEEYSKDAIYHELFHLASSVYKDNVVYGGFTQWNESMNIGVGLTEGYTQLLTNRYFPSDRIGEFYSIDASFAGLLELIIGVEDMSKFYFNSNLKGLIDKLSKYNDVDNIMKFLYWTDYVNSHKLYSFNYEEDKVSKNLLIKYCKEIKRFLMITYLRKFADELKIKRSENDNDDIMQIAFEYYNFINQITDNNVIVDNSNGNEIEIISNNEIENLSGKVLGIKKFKIFE